MEPRQSLRRSARWSSNSLNGSSTSTNPARFLGPSETHEWANGSLNSTSTSTTRSRLVVAVAPELPRDTPLNSNTLALKTAKWAVLSNNVNFVTIAHTRNNRGGIWEDPTPQHFGRNVTVVVTSAEERYRVLRDLSANDRLSPTTQPLGRLTAVIVTQALSARPVLENLATIELLNPDASPFSRVALVPDYTVQEGAGANRARRDDPSLVSLPASHGVSNEAIWTLLGYDTILTSRDARGPIVERLIPLAQESGLINHHRLTSVRGHVSELDETLSQRLDKRVLGGALPPASAVRDLANNPSLPEIPPEHRPRLREFGALVWDVTGLGSTGRGIGRSTDDSYGLEPSDSLGLQPQAAQPLGPDTHEFRLAE